MDILPSNVADWPSQPPPRHRRTRAALRLLLAIVVVGALVGTLQTFVGFDQLARSIASVSSSVRLPGSDPPQSRNWAGYSATGGTFTAVSATWNVPEFAPDSPAG